MPDQLQKDPVRRLVTLLARCVEAHVGNAEHNHPEFWASIEQEVTNYLPLFKVEPGVLDVVPWYLMCGHHSDTTVAIHGERGLIASGLAPMTAHSLVVAHNLELIPKALGVVRALNEGADNGGT